ncbi:MAG: hypothetical protein ACLTMP_13655 [Eggerthella lenta]
MISAVVLSRRMNSYFRPAAFHHVHERLHAERVVLRGHGQPQVGGAPSA